MYTTKNLLNKLNSSGINISPRALMYLKSLSLNAQDLEKIIQKLSFSPQFKSHITMKTVQKDFKEIFEPFFAEKLLTQNKEIKIIKTNNNFKKKKKIIKNSETKNKKLPKDLLKNNNVQPKNALLSPSKNELDEKKIIKLEDNEGSISNESFPNCIRTENNSERSQITKKNRSKEWEPLRIRRSTVTFKAIASNYTDELKILKDPTGKLYTEGKIEEFLAVQNDKFQKISKILRKRPESSGLLEINMINRLNNPVNIKFIGMVVEKRQTLNRNFLITFEDPTGTCKAIVRKGSNNAYNLMSNLLLDHIVIVDAFLSVNKDSNSRIVIVNEIIFPDSPNEHKISYPEEDLAICLISDTHFGSKEWLEKVWYRFVDYLNCRIGNDRQIEQAGKIKYLCIAGDIVDGIGIYPNQDKRLSITDIYQQYEVSAKYLSEIPDYIKIIISPGDHDSVRKAIPSPAIPKDFAPVLYDMGATMVGCPSLVSLHGIKVQLFHGTSLIDINMMIPGLTNADPVSSMKELIKSRHLAPVYGKKTEIAPVSKDWLVMDELPDILHTGHLHKNGFGWHHGILMVNSGCFQDQTDFMKSLGIVPDYGKPTIVSIKNKLVPQVINLIGDMS